MLYNSSVIVFVATTRADDARSFYEGILGLRLVMDDAFAIVFDANNVMLRVQKVQEHTPLPYTVLGWDVTDIHASVEELSKRSIKCDRYEGLEQDELGVWLSPSGARIAWFKDPDGNILSLTQSP